MDKNTLLTRKAIVITEPDYRLPHKILEVCYKIIVQIYTKYSFFKLKKNDFVFISNDISVEAISYKNKHTFEYYRPDNLDENFTLAETFAKNWVGFANETNNIQQILLYRDVPIARVIERDFLIYLMESIKYIDSITNMLEVEKPDYLILTDKRFLFEKLTLKIAEQKKIPILFILPNRISNIKYNLLLYFKYLSRFRIHSITHKKPQFNFVNNSKKEHKNVLIQAFFPSHVPTVLAIIDELLNKTEIDFRVTLITTKKIASKLENIPNLTVKLFDTYSRTQDIDKDKSKKIEVLWNFLKSNGNFREFMTYKSISLWGIFDDRVSEYYFAKKIHEAMQLINTSLRIIELEKPEILISVNDVRNIERAMIFSANSKSIPTLLVQHGVINNNSTPEYGAASNIAIFGEFTKNILLKRGISKKKIVITGNPLFDKLINFTYNKKEILKKLELNPAKKIIVFASQPLPDLEERKRIFIAVTEVLKTIHDVQIVVKPHPAEMEDFYKNIDIPNTADSVIITKKVDLYGLLYSCDLLITGFSTTALEAMILNKPVITVNFSGKSDIMPYAKSGAAIGVYKEEDLLNAVRNIINNEGVVEKLTNNRRQFVYEHAFKTDGNASKRVLNYIEQLTHDDGSVE